MSQVSNLIHQKRESRINSEHVVGRNKYKRKINEVENKCEMDMNNRAKSWFFEKNNAVTKF